MPTLLCDLDGVVWLAHEAIDGAVDAIRRCRRAGWEVGFVTNNSVATIAEHEAALAGIGLDATGVVISSATAAGACVDTGERVGLVGGPGVAEAVWSSGAVGLAVDDGVSDLDAVVVGLDRAFTFERLHHASRAIRGGARFVATNTDASFPMPTGPTPGAGAIVAAVAVASGVEPEVAGKPHRPMATVVRRRFPGDGRIVVVGDRIETDGRFAAELGAEFALVRSGVTPPGADVTGELAAVPTIADVPDLADLVDRLIASR